MSSEQQVIERVVRESYGRLVAYLSSRCRDVQLVEDALSEALLAALKDWPVSGLPDLPEAWLLTVARRRLVDVRRKASRDELAWKGMADAIRTAQQIEDAGTFPDERLKLLFVCAHPAIDEHVRAPLMLSTLFGLTAEQIAASFLISPTTMGQRLVRAKQRISGLNLPFDVPEGERLGERLGSVLDAVYVAFCVAWEELGAATESVRSLGEEALQLAELIARMMPEEAEAHGLWALLLYLKSRENARRDADGRYVALSDQDVSCWSIELIRQAEEQLRVALKHKKLGRFQWEASIQSLHAARLWTERIDWESLCRIYDELAKVHGSAGVYVGRAAARGEAFGLEAGLNSLEELDHEEMYVYQPYWATRGHLLEHSGRLEEARDCFERAMEMTPSAAVREWLRNKALNARR